jgi:transposase InsO family protein
MNYRLVLQLQEKAISVQHCCQVLALSRSGYYAAQQRRLSPPSVCPTTVHLKSLFEASGRSYGSRRLCRDLNQQGISIGRYRVRRLMRTHQLKPVWQRKFIHTADSKHTLPVFENVLNRRFTPAKTYQAWVADITYIGTCSGWLYLAAVLDLYSRKIVGWAMAPNMPVELVCTALQIPTRGTSSSQPAPGLIVHSDRGSQYASQAASRFTGSICAARQNESKGQLLGGSAPGNNAVMERFFLNLKMERVWRSDYANHQEDISDITDYIVGFYNSKHLHSTLGYLPPNGYERKMSAQQPISVPEVS